MMHLRGNANKLFLLLGLFTFLLNIQLSFSQIELSEGVFASYFEMALHSDLPAIVVFDT